MKKNKRFVQRFISHLFGMYNVPKIPIYVHYGYPSCIDPDGNVAFGVYCYPKDGKGETCIHIAGEIGTTGIISCIAHEFVHHMQRINGRDMDDVESIERDAEYWGAGLMGQWLINKTKRREQRCFGIFPIWEHAPKDSVPK